MTPIDRSLRALLTPIDAAWLAVYRVLFGLALGISMLRFPLNGWVDALFVEPTFFFKYWGFEWVEPLSASHMHVLFVGLALLAFAMAAGLAFRFVAPAFALGLTYVQLIDVSNYLNHYYLAALLAWLLSVSPAARLWSVDAWLARRFLARPRPDTVARAWLYLFRFQIGLVYVFAGLAKAQSDWLLHAQPLRIWLGANTDLPVLGPLLALDWVPLVMSWCGFLFDTTIVGFLLFRRTRPYAYGVVIVFHTLTRLLFPIGMFPVIMTVSALFFFEPDWPRALARRLFGTATRSMPVLPLPALPSPGIKLGLLAMAAYCALQLLLPVRFLAYGGNVLWHEQGMRFSWRVMLRAKGGNTTFVVRNRDSGRVWHVPARQYLTGLQEAEMSSQPDLILQLAHHIERDFAARRLGPVEVRAESSVTLNGRRGVPFLDPNVDLTAERDGLGLARFVLPAPSSPPPHTRPVL
ncbi:MAG TPA: HTTM domain-containing protein [Polyangiaceae bacterium]|nr:HTTM domain-containing protein [Polyangiaceae bacterium]